MACKQAAMSWIFNGAGLFWNYLCWWKCSLVSHRKKYPIPQTLHVSPKNPDPGSRGGYIQKKKKPFGFFLRCVRDSNP